MSSETVVYVDGSEVEVDGSELLLQPANNNAAAGNRINNFLFIFASLIYYKNCHRKIML